MRTYSWKELIKREYHKRLRIFKSWCNTYKITYYTYKDAPEDSICAMSLNEFDVEMVRKDIEENNECYFLSILDFEIYQSLCIYEKE